MAGLKARQTDSLTRFCSTSELGRAQHTNTPVSRPVRDPSFPPIMLQTFQFGVDLGGGRVGDNFHWVSGAALHTFWVFGQEQEMELRCWHPITASLSVGQEPRTADQWHAVSVSPGCLNLWPDWLNRQSARLSAGRLPVPHRLTATAGWLVGAPVTPPASCFHPATTTRPGIQNTY